MEVETVSRIFSLLALLAATGGVLAAIVRFVPLTSLQPLRDAFAPMALWLAALVALTATVGSLYYSERVGFVPCRLCWYQRIAMYPLALQLSIAAVVRVSRIRLLLMPPAGIGLGLSIYHYLLEVFPSAGGSCSLEAPCNVRQVEQFGFISIPFMAGCGFLAIIGLLTLANPPKETILP